MNNFHRGDVVEPEDHAYATALGPLISRTAGNRAAFYLQPVYTFHSNTYSTAGCLEHIEHGHDVPGCAGVETGIKSNTLMVGLTTTAEMARGAANDRDWFLGFFCGSSIS